MTAINPDRCSCAHGRWYAAGIVCLVVGMCCTGCGRTQESHGTPPSTVDAAPAPAKKAPRPAARTPQPVAAAEEPAPAPAVPAAEVVAEQPEVAVSESVVVAEKPARVAEAETLEEIVDATAEEMAMVEEKPAPPAERPAPPVERPARVVTAEPAETPIVEAVEHALPLEPESPPDHAGLAVAAMEQGDCERALEHFHYARQASPDDLDLRLWEAQAYRSCGWPAVAVELLNELDARSRAREAIAAEIAECLHLLDEPGRAAMVWELRYIHHPKAWQAAARAAEAWLAAGQRKPAQWWFEQARMAAPNTPEVRALATAFQSAAITDR